MEDKTILEELLERAPDERLHKRKMDKAYHLLTEGMCGEAEALFDEILAEEPFNRDALTGKKLIERRRAIESRMDSLTHRARSALPEAQPADEPAVQPEPAEGEKNAQAHEPKLRLLRSKKVKAALIAVFALLVAAAAAFIVTSYGDSAEASLPPRTDAFGSEQYEAGDDEQLSQQIGQHNAEMRFEGLSPAEAHIEQY